MPYRYNENQVGRVVEFELEFPFDVEALAMALYITLAENSGYEFTYLRNIRDEVYGFYAQIDKVKLEGQTIITGEKFRLKVGVSHTLYTEYGDIYKATLNDIREVLRK